MFEVYYPMKSGTHTSLIVRARQTTEWIIQLSWAILFALIVAYLAAPHLPMIPVYARQAAQMTGRWHGPAVADAVGIDPVVDFSQRMAESASEKGEIGYDDIVAHEAYREDETVRQNALEDHTARSSLPAVSCGPMQSYPGCIRCSVGSDSTTEVWYAFPAKASSEVTCPSGNWWG